MPTHEVATLERGDESVSASQVATLMHLAVEKGMGVDVLERLFALDKEISQRNARAAFFQALARFRAECPPIRKTRENSQFTVTRDGVKRPSKYAALEDIDPVAGPVASACGLVWTWDTRLDEAHMHVTCRLLHVLGHSESSTVSMPYESKAGASPQQKYGSTQTYGMRYSLIAALGLTTADEDTDGSPAIGSDPDVITPEQEATLNALGREVNANEARFLKLFKIKAISELPANRYAEAVTVLEQMRRAT